MNKVEAKEILGQELSRLQEESFDNLQKFIKSPEVVERCGRIGLSYQIEIQVFWDNPHDAGGDLRIIASIDDGGFFSALFPLSGDFIMDSDGHIKGD